MKKYDSFSFLLEKSSFSKSNISSSFLEGSIVSNNNNMISIDLGLKRPTQFKENELRYSNLHSDSDLFCLKKSIQLSIWEMETSENELLCDPYSYEQHLHEFVTWDYVSKQDFVKGIIVNSVNGGFSVAIGGIIAFLPRSLAKLPRIGKTQHVHFLMKNYCTYKVVTVNDSTRNIVVSLWKTNG